MKERTAAVLTIRAPERMTKRGRKAIAGWLKRQARHFIARGDRYAKNYKAKYIYT